MHAFRLAAYEDESSVTVQDRTASTAEKFEANRPPELLSIISNCVGLTIKCHVSAWHMCCSSARCIMHWTVVV
jgi:hypothetical protein